MLHPHTELKFINPEVGYGVVATQPIPKGTITWVQDSLDRVFSPKEVEKMEPMYQEILEVYTFRNNQGNHVLCWDNGRFVNHSFRSNCLTTAYDFEIAIRDIEVGEELTDDYGYLNITEPFRARDEGTQRKIVYPDDLPKYYKKWDRQLQQVFPFIPTLPQPLQTFIQPELWAKIERVASSQESMTSILNCYFPNGQARND